MRENKQKFATEFTSRLSSADWDKKMYARVEGERKDRLHVRIRVMAVVSAVFIGAFALTATWWEDDATSNHLYSSMEEAAGGLQMQVSFSE